MAGLGLFYQSRQVWHFFLGLFVNFYVTYSLACHILKTFHKAIVKRETEVDIAMVIVSILQFLCTLSFLNLNFYAEPVPVLFSFQFVHVLCCVQGILLLISYTHEFLHA